MPKIMCPACGSRDTDWLFDLSSIKIFKGGFMAKSDFIYIDFKKEPKLIKYAHTMGMKVDLRRSKKHIMESLDAPDEIYKEIILSEKEYEKFIRDLSRCMINYWKKSYCDLDILDGIQWEMEFTFKDRRKRSIWGSNAFPPYWDKFWKIMEKYIGV